MEAVDEKSEIENQLIDMHNPAFDLIVYYHHQFFHILIDEFKKIKKTK